MKNDIWAALNLQRGGPVHGGGGVLLISTENVVDQRKEYFECLLIPTNAPSSKEAGPEDSRTSSHISEAEVAVVVKKKLLGDCISEQKKVKYQNQLEVLLF